MCRTHPAGPMQNLGKQDTILPSMPHIGAREDGLGDNSENSYTGRGGVTVS
jgi:hypothetical protein